MGDTSNEIEKKPDKLVNRRFLLVNAAFLASGLLLIAVCAFGASKVDVFLDERASGAGESLALILLVGLPHAILETFRWLGVGGVLLLGAAVVFRRDVDKSRQYLLVGAIAMIFCACSALALLVFPRVDVEDPRVSEFDRNAYKPIVEQLDKWAPPSASSKR